MRKQVVIFGTILIAALLIFSGSTVAAWVYVTYVDEEDCTYPGNIDGSPDGSDATIGKNPATLGIIWLELNLSDEMGPSQDFTVFADSSIAESYNAYVSETRDVEAILYVGSGNDTKDETFTTPSQPFNAAFRYIFIEATSGTTGDGPYGPDIDAVGWDKP